MNFKKSFILIVLILSSSLMAKSFEKSQVCIKKEKSQSYKELKEIIGLTTPQAAACCSWSEDHIPGCMTGC